MNDVSSSIEKNILEAVNEIDLYCKENDWISKIKVYTSEFSKKKVLEWKTTGAFEIDEQLGKIKCWIEQIKTSVDAELITKNRLFKIDCRPIEAILIPKLETIFNEICECIVTEITYDLSSFVKTISNALEVI